MIKMFFTLFFISVLPSLVSAQSLDGIYKNNQAVKKFAQDKKMSAYEDFVSLLSDDPYNSTFQFNLGSALSGIGDEEKAKALYLQLLKDVDQRLAQTQDKDERQQLLKVRFAILYNLGVHFQTLQEINQALTYYQMGLEMLPNSKEIKTNIEMMFSGGGKGKGKGSKKNKDQNGEGGEGDSQDQEDGENEQKQDQPRSNGDRQDKQDGQKGFDQKQMSQQDLDRIMEELKQQEQNIRSKVQRKGAKSAPKDKQW